MRRRLQVAIGCCGYALLWLVCTNQAVFAAENEWQEVKGKHFIVYFKENHQRAVGKRLLRTAEGYYRDIGDLIGYTRYGGFWTWEDRAKIFLFPGKEDFLATTGQPEWSTGYAVRDERVFKTRTIVTYDQEEDFFTGLLPHEISHLILRDFLQFDAIPIWFDEGVAQLQEKDKSAVARRIMRTLVSRKAYIPFSMLLVMDIRQEKDEGLVSIFYAQSLTVVEFLLQKYGRAAFVQFCRALRDGASQEDAFRKAYTNRLNSVETLEKKWLRYIRSP